MQPCSDNNDIVLNVHKGNDSCSHPGGIAISNRTAKALGVNIGDPVLITGRRATVGVVECFKEMDESAVCLGGGVSTNAGADGSVSVRRLDSILPAQKVVIAVPSNEEVEPSQAHRTLKGLFVCKGDTVGVPGCGLAPLKAEVIRTTPNAPVQIGDEAEITVRKVFSRAGSQYDFARIGGLKEVLHSLKDMELRLLNQKRLEKYGCGPVRGAIVTGPRGAGKSTLLSSFVNESRANCILLRGQELAGLDHGECENRLQQAFTEAAKGEPSIILIDDLDTVCPKRGSYSQPEEKRAVNALLGLFDRLPPEAMVMVIATAQEAGALDQALRRPGRFDKEFEISVPNLEERVEILKIYTASLPMAQDVSLERVARPCHGYSGADLEFFCKEVLWYAVRKSGVAAEFEAALRNGEILTRADETEELVIEESDFLGCAKAIRPSLGRELVAEVPEVAWEDVGGYEDVKEELQRQVITMLEHRALAKKYGVMSPTGFLLHGPPGTGKTLISKALATTLGVKVIVAKLADLLSKWLGDYEKNIARMFEVAMKSAPVLLLLDEVETIAAMRGSAPGEGSRAMESGLNLILQYLDGVNRMEDVLVVCTTNRLDLLDEAFVRSGRIGTKIFMGKPDEEARKQIFEVHLRGIKGRFEGVDAAQLARLSDGFVGADIKEVVRYAVSNVFHEYVNAGAKGPFVVHAAHLKGAVEVVKKGLRGRNETPYLP